MSWPYLRMERTSSHDISAAGIEISISAVIVGGSSHFLSRQKILGFAREARYALIEVDDSFLKSHMIIALRPDRPN
jgi:hypothetical protein